MYLLEFFFIQYFTNKPLLQGVYITLYCRFSSNKAQQCLYLKLFVIIPKRLAVDSVHVCSVNNVNSVFCSETFSIVPYGLLLCKDACASASYLQRRLVSLNVFWDST